MKLSVLIENTTNNPELAHEHGLSLFIETNGQKIVVDMGQSEKFAENAMKMGIDLSKANFAILSHGHYDHGGGVAAFLKINKQAHVYIHGNAFNNFYNAKKKYIGLDLSIQKNAKIILTQEYTELTPTICLKAKNLEKPYYPQPKHNLTIYTDKEYKTDPFWHEQYLCINENGKKIVISGCSHKGVLNILEWFQPDILIGGFHFNQYDLKNENDCKELKDIAQKMAEYPTQFYTGHCTGLEQYQFIKAVLGKNINYLSTGQQINI